MEGQGNGQGRGAVWKRRTGWSMHHRLYWAHRPPLVLGTIEPGAMYLAIVADRVSCCRAPPLSVDGGCASIGGEESEES